MSILLELRDEPLRGLSNRVSKNLRYKEPRLKQTNNFNIISQLVHHRAAAYYQLFSGNRIVISGETWSKYQFFPKKVKNYKS